MNKYFLVLLSVSLLLLVLCLKISLIEYFTSSENNMNTLQKKLSSNFGISNNVMNEVRQKCYDELNEALEDKSMKHIINGIINNDFTSILSFATTVKPKSIEKLSTCLKDKNINLGGGLGIL